MDCLLISGAQDTGKTTTIFGLYALFLNRGFTIIHQEPAQIAAPLNNMRAVLQNPVNQRRLLLNSRSDYPGNGQELISYYQRYLPIDVVVTSIRDQGDERTDMEAAVRSLAPFQTVEVPLAKVTRINNRAAAETNYWNRVLALCAFILAGQPFSI